MKIMLYMLAIVLILISGCMTPQQQTQEDNSSQTDDLFEPEQSPVDTVPLINYPIDKSFETLAKQPTGGYLEDKDLVITNEEEFEAVWDEAYSNSTGTIQTDLPALPEIDFGSEMVIAVFMGIQPTGGYATEIVSLTETETTLEVKIKETSRKPGDPVIQVETAPFHIVKTEKTGKVVVFTN